MHNLQQALCSCELILKRLQIPYCPPLRIISAGSLKSSWGRCSKKEGGWQIEINSRLTQPDVPIGALYTTILHELLHTCPGCANHGPEWKRHAKKVRNKTNLPIQRTINLDTYFGFEYAQNEPRYRYVVYCTQCGKQSKYQRRSKVINEIEHYRCGRCNGPLKWKEYDGQD